MSIPSYGGQAVLEGVVMRGPKYAVLCSRAPDGDIVQYVKKAPTPGERKSILRLPLLRGAFSLWDSMSLGVEMLFKSASISSSDEMEEGSFAFTLAAILAVTLAIGLFIVLPAFLSLLLFRFVSFESRLLMSFLETVIRLFILFGYIFLISKMEDIQRVLQYHGAEHKVIWAFEKNYETIEKRFQEEGFEKEELAQFLAEKALGESTLHPRCGTSFLFLTVLITWVIIFIYSPTGYLAKVGFRLLTLPLVAGLSYEVLKLSANNKSKFWDFVKAPGLFLQKMTTKEPDKEQLLVSAESLSLLVEAERGGNL